MSHQQFEQRILHQMKSRLEAGKHPITEGYLKFIFEDLMDEYSGLVSNNITPKLYENLKAQFTIDPNIPDLWAAPDAAFETRVIEIFAARLSRSDEFTVGHWTSEIIFHRLLWDMIHEEQVHLTYHARKDLYDKIKAQLGL